MVSEYDELTLLSNKATHYQFDEPSATILEAFPNPRPGRPYVVGLECLEFTSLCPITAQPDYGTISIAYVPDARCVESKSLKLYLVAYRNHGAFHEDCVNSIAEDLIRTIDPLCLRVFGEFNARGGIAIHPLVMHYRAGLDPARVQEVRDVVFQYDQVRPR